MTGGLFRKSLLTTGVLALRLITQAATLVLLTRLLGPSSYGHFASAASLAVVMGTLPTFGAGFVLLRQASGRLEAAAHVWRYAWPMTAVLGVLLLAAYVTLGHWLVDGQLGWRLLLMMGVAELLATPFTTLGSFALQAAERVPLSQLVQWFPLGLRVLAVLPCYALPAEQRVQAYVAFQLVASLAGALLSGWLASRQVPLDWRPRVATRSELKDGGSYAAMLIVSSNPSELDKIIAVRQVGPADAGVYVAASRVMGALVMPVLAMLLTAQPRLFRHAREQDADAPRLVRTLFAWALAWGSASGALLALASPLLPWIFGQPYVRMAQLAPWMALTAPFMSLRLAAGSVLVAWGHPLERMAFEFSGIMLLLLGMLALTPALGVLGLVVAVILAEVAMAVIGLIMVARYVRAVFAPQAAG